MDPEANVNSKHCKTKVAQLQQQIAAASTAYQQIAAANNNVGNNKIFESCKARKI